MTKKYQDEVSKTILCLTQKTEHYLSLFQLESIKWKCLSWQHNNNFHKSGSFVFVCITTSTFISLLKCLQMSHYFDVKLFIPLNQRIQVTRSPMLQKMAIKNKTTASNNIVRVQIA